MIGLAFRKHTIKKRLRFPEGEEGEREEGSIEGAGEGAREEKGGETFDKIQPEWLGAISSHY